MIPLLNSFLRQEIKENYTRKKNFYDASLIKQQLLRSRNIEIKNHVNKPWDRFDYFTFRHEPEQTLSCTIPDFLKSLNPEMDGFNFCDLDSSSLSINRSQILSKKYTVTWKKMQNTTNYW